MASSLIVRKLIVDENSELLDTQGMKYKEYASRRRPQGLPQGVPRGKPPGTAAFRTD
jgi:hypothetical protein